MGFVIDTIGKSERGSIYILNAPASPTLPAESSAVTSTLYLPCFFSVRSKDSSQLSGFSAVRVSTLPPADRNKVRKRYTQTQSSSFFIAVPYYKINELSFNTEAFSGNLQKAPAGYNFSRASIKIQPIFKDVLYCNSDQGY